MFDGVCNLCNSLVVFAIKRDPDGDLKFASLQSDTGQEILQEFDLPTEKFETFVLVENGEVYTKSTAALRTARYLRFPWQLLYPFIFVPRPIRDFFYSVIANNRYNWFGRKDECMVPSPELKDRFLD